MSYPWHLPHWDDATLFMLDSLGSSLKIVDLFELPYSRILTLAQRGVGGPGPNAMDNAKTHRPGNPNWDRPSQHYTLPMGDVKKPLNDSHTLRWFMENPSVDQHGADIWPSGVKSQLQMLNRRQWRVHWLTIPNTTQARQAISNFFPSFITQLNSHNKQFTLGQYFGESRAFWTAQQAETGINYLQLFEDARDLGILSCHTGFVANIKENLDQIAPVLEYFAPDYESEIVILSVNDECWNGQACYSPSPGDNCKGDYATSDAC